MTLPAPRLDDRRITPEEDRGKAGTPASDNRPHRRVVQPWLPCDILPSQTAGQERHGLVPASPNLRSERHKEGSRDAVLILTLELLPAASGGRVPRSSRAGRHKVIVGAEHRVDRNIIGRRTACITG